MHLFVLCTLVFCNVQTAVIGTVAPSGTGFVQEVYNLLIEACGKAGGCSTLPLTVFVRDAIVFEPARSIICYLGIVSVLLHICCAWARADYSTNYMCRRCRERGTQAM